MMDVSEVADDLAPGEGPDDMDAAALVRAYGAAEYLRGMNDVIRATHDAVGVDETADEGRSLWDRLGALWPGSGGRERPLTVDVETLHQLEAQATENAEAVETRAEACRAELVDRFETVDGGPPMFQ